MPAHVIARARSSRWTPRPRRPLAKRPDDATGTRR